ncbi:MAG TPA: hypothetical protein V6D29_23735 [Leptolyngbyaceae cyanobacterium]
MTPQVLYKPQSEDTSIEADRLIFQLLRQQPVSKRVEMASKHSQGINRLCLSGVKRRNPSAPLPVIGEKFALAKLGKIPPGLTLTGEDEEMWVHDSISLARQLDQILEENGIFYYVTNEVAASTHGEPRSTIDLDLVVQISAVDVEEMADMLTSQGFLCSGLDEVRRDISPRFQAIEGATITKADIYISSGSAFANSQMSRRLRIAEDFYVCSAEDIVLRKLVWRKTSQPEKQWRDVLGVIKLQQQDLDRAYLSAWAVELGVSAELTQALQEAGEEDTA